jgi:hypothetical protein
MESNPSNSKAAVTESPRARARRFPDSIRKLFDASIGHEEAWLDPTEMINAMVSIVPADTGKFRNVVPKAVEEFLKTHEKEAWETTFDSEAMQPSSGR